MKYDQPQDIWEGVTACPLHGDGPFDYDCTACDTELAARSAIIDQMQAEANHRVQGLAQQGAQMPPWTMIEARLDVLLDSILTDPRQRIQYEGEVGRRIMLMVQDIQNQVKQPTLHVAKEMPKGAHPLRRQ